MFHVILGTLAVIAVVVIGKLIMDISITATRAKHEANK